MRDLKRTIALVASAVAVVGAALLFVVPTKATYLDRVGSDFALYQQVDCGMPIATFLGADPDLARLAPTGTAHARNACEAAAGTRVAGGLSLLLVLATAAWITARSAEPGCSTDVPGGRNRAHSAA